MQSTIVRTVPTAPVVWCVDCTEDAEMVRQAGRGQDLVLLATTVRAGRDVCGTHGQMHDDLAADLAAEEIGALDNLLLLVEATVWATKRAVCEIDSVWVMA